jgi:hypothetical protein
MIKKIIFFLTMFLLSSTCFAEPPQINEQKKAEIRAEEIVPFLSEYKQECKILRNISIMEKEISVTDINDTYFLLDSPIIKKNEDHYQPVRFAHKRHAALINDCSECHHYRPENADMLETTRCSACHQESFKPENPERIGLKAAFHKQCIECHQKEQNGPISCTGCHLKNVPDHKQLVKLPENPKPSEVTVECLKCHQKEAEDFIKTSHWLWKGPSLYTVKHRKDIQHGKATTALNNY